MLVLIRKSVPLLVPVPVLIPLTVTRTLLLTFSTITRICGGETLKPPGTSLYIDDLVQELRDSHRSYDIRLGGISYVSFLVTAILLRY